MYRLAAFIVEKRYLFFLLYVFAILFCLFSMNWVMVENDVTTYLPGDTETRQGLTAMNENFVTFASARVMVSNVTFGTAEEISGVIEGIPGVDRVEFDSSGEHYKDAAALYDVSFTGETADKESIEAVEESISLFGRTSAVSTESATPAVPNRCRRNRFWRWKICRRRFKWLRFLSSMKTARWKRSVWNRVAGWIQRVFRSFPQRRDTRLYGKIWRTRCLIVFPLTLCFLPPICPL